MNDDKKPELENTKTITGGYSTQGPAEIISAAAGGYETAIIGAFLGYFRFITENPRSYDDERPRNQRGPFPE